ncbi:hypothetical protein SBD_5045 [Streptomyces bottropensis ATCC 25435]|uniref:Uncharacterized protein n=1 Tax=Streptomyces bottropensis ATCC 25435 TaxID=1054862 RepID=M3EBE2_9ACTN|nr:hypothetical protein SBD_5045 [Streptomyces bottropensis ATCC 25435]
MRMPVDEGCRAGGQLVHGRIAEEWRQGTHLHECGAVGSPGVHGVHTVSHGRERTSTPWKGREVDKLAA